MNKVELIGRLTKDVELKRTNSGLATATITIAVDRRVKSGEEKKTDFPRVVVWGVQAENCAKYLAKGLRVSIVGSLQTGSYQNKDGMTVYTCDVNADEIEFLDWKDKNGQQPHGNPNAQGYGAPAMQQPTTNPQSMAAPQQTPPVAGQPMMPQQQMAPVAGQPMMPQQQMAPVTGQPMMPQQQMAPNGFTVTGDPYKNF